MIKKLKKNYGFTLTEVMIGMMILTVAIVTATQLLVSLIGSNMANVKSLQAYYLAQEGIEAVRNIRDTNWMHNLNWLGDDSGEPWGEKFEAGNEYSVDLRQPSHYSAGVSIAFNELSAYAPWGVLTSVGGEISFVNGELSGFNRTISVSDYDSGSVLVQSKVIWQEGSRDGEVILEEILTNWQ